MLIREAMIDELLEQVENLEDLDVDEVEVDELNDEVKQIIDVFVQFDQTYDQILTPTLSDVEDFILDNVDEELEIEDIESWLKDQYVV